VIAGIAPGHFFGEHRDPLRQSQPHRDRHHGGRLPRPRASPGRDRRL